MHVHGWLLVGQEAETRRRRGVKGALGLPRVDRKMGFAFALQG
jgi:hypothetical protein